MTPDTIPQLDPDTLYELCPDCGGIRGRFWRVARVWAWLRGERAGFCLTCMDEGLVPHDCPED